MPADVCGDQECGSAHHGGRCSGLRPSDRETDPGRKMRNASRLRGRGGEVPAVSQISARAPAPQPAAAQPHRCLRSRLQEKQPRSVDSDPDSDPLRRFLEPGVTWERTLPSRSSRDVRKHQSNHPKQEKKSIYSQKSDTVTRNAETFPLTRCHGNSTLLF